MIPIIKWTLWQRRISTLWWAIAVFALIFVTLLVYPPFRDQAAQLQKSFENLPQAAIQLFGGSADFFSPVGYLNSQIFFITLPITLGILGIALGHSLIGKEEQDLTIESLLARPVSRTKLLFSKAAAGGIIVTLISLVCLVTIIVMAKVVKLNVANKLIFQVILVCWLMSLTFGAIAFLFSALGRARSASIGITAFIALGGYIISSLAGTVDWLKTPAKIFPFHYYQSNEILNQTYNWANVYFFVVVILVCAFLSWLVFRRRDVY